MLNMDATEFIIERTPIPQGGKGDKHGSGISPTGNRGKEHGPRRTPVQNSGNGIFKVLVFSHTSLTKTLRRSTNYTNKRRINTKLKDR
jgi:hypothetical protein